MNNPTPPPGQLPEQNWAVDELFARACGFDLELPVPDAPDDGSHAAGEAP